MEADTAYRTTVFSDVAPGELRPALVEDIENARGEGSILITDPRAKFVGREIEGMGASYDRRLRGFTIPAGAPQASAILERVGRNPMVAPPGRFARRIRRASHAFAGRKRTGSFAPRRSAQREDLTLRRAHRGDVPPRARGHRAGDRGNSRATGRP